MCAVVRMHVCVRVYMCARCINVDSICWWAASSSGGSNSRAGKVNLVKVIMTRSRRAGVFWSLAKHFFSETQNRVAAAADTRG